MFDTEKFEKALCADDDVYIKNYIINNNVIHDVDEKTGLTPLFLTASCGSYKYLVFIIEFIKSNYGNGVLRILNEKNKFGKSLLHYTVEHNSIQCTEYLLQNGVDPNVSCNKLLVRYNTPVQIASGNDNLELLKLLIQYGGKFDLKDEGGTSPLDVAMANNALSCGKYLVALGADIFDKTDDGYTPLHFAQFVDINKGTDCIEWLIAQGADLEAKTERGNTPLHIAARQYNYKAIEVLLAHGADINVQNTSSGDTPLHVLLDRYDVSQGDYGDDDDDDDDEEEEIDLVKLAVAALLKYHPNLELRNQEGKTVLNVAVRHGNCVSTLLEHGADVNARSGFTGETALEYALRNRYRYLSGELYPYLDDDGKKKIDAMYAEEGWTSP